VIKRSSFGSEEIISTYEAITNCIENVLNDPQERINCEFKDNSHKIGMPCRFTQIVVITGVVNRGR